jgi:peptide/nickel transport system permease protein
MTHTIDTAVAPIGEVRRRGGFALVVAGALRSNRGRFAAVVLLIVLAIAVIGPFVAPYSSTEVVTATFDKPGSGTIFGGDNLGRDVLSRVLHGGWVLILLALAATAIGLVVGTIGGLLAAYVGGKTDAVIMRIVDIVLALPQIIFALLLLSVVGPKIWLLVVAVGLSHAPQVARVVYAAAQDVTERDFVKVAQLWGMPPLKVITSEILPNLLTPLMVEAGLRTSYSVIMISGLSFLGFGRQPPAADWGLMINENRLGLYTNPWCMALPALLIALLAVGINMLTDAIARASLGDERGEDAVLSSTLGTVVEK